MINSISNSSTLIDYEEKTFLFHYRSVAYNGIDDNDFIVTATEFSLIL